MTLLDPLFLQNEDYTATQFRQLASSFLRSGVVGATDLKVTQRSAGTNMSVDVAAGSVVVEGTDQVDQGVYLCTSTDVVNVTISAAPSAGNTRLDLIVAEVRDGDQNAGPNNDWQIRVVEGVAATTPVEPTIPDSCTVLGRVSVASGTAAVTNAMIADRRTFSKQLSYAASGTLPLGRTGDLVAETNTGVIRKGNVDGTWYDIHVGYPSMAAISGTAYGTAPSTTGTVFKLVTGVYTVGVVSGMGQITLPITFTGILTYSVIPQANSPIYLTERTDSGGAVTGSVIPLYAWDPIGGDVNGKVTIGSFPVRYTVIGW